MKPKWIKSALYLIFPKMVTELLHGFEHRLRPSTAPIPNREPLPLHPLVISTEFQCDADALCDCFQLTHCLSVCNASSFTNRIVLFRSLPFCTFDLIQFTKSTKAISTQNCKVSAQSTATTTKLRAQRIYKNALWAFACFHSKWVGFHNTPKPHPFETTNSLKVRTEREQRNGLCSTTAF